MTDADTCSCRLFCTWSKTQPCFPGAWDIPPWCPEITGASHSCSSADRFCFALFMCTCSAHTYRTPSRGWNEQNNPGMEKNRIWPFHCVYQATGQLMTIMGIHSRASQWNQRPSFALKMGNIFLWHKPTEPDLACCIYFQGELSKTTTICLSCVYQFQSIPWILKLCFNNTNDQLQGKQSCLRHHRASIDFWEIFM